MNTFKRVVMILCLGFVAATASAFAEAVEEIAEDSRCQVCGMFVAKYPNWVTQIHSADGKVTFFDGVKDMMVFYFNSDKYGVKADAIKEIWVKDYYTMAWLDGRKAHYVIGSDVHGPMGHELIPFATKEAADSFLKDHHGKAVVAFDDITSEKVESMRMGMKMKKMNMNMK
jgi:nitrous oxide reductase accessory protein NosL